MSPFGKVPSGIGSLKSGMSSIGPSPRLTVKKPKIKRLQFKSTNRYTPKLGPGRG